MKSLYFDGKLAVRDVPTPQRAPGEALIKVLLAGICGTDRVLSRHGRIIRQNSAPVFRVGKADYKAVLVPPMLTIATRRCAFSNGSAPSAGRWYSPANPPTIPRRSATPSPRSCATLPPDAGQRDRSWPPPCRRSADGCALPTQQGRRSPGVLYLLREARDAFHLFLCNTGYTAAQVRRLPLNRDPEGPPTGGRPFRR